MNDFAGALAAGLPLRSRGSTESSSLIKGAPEADSTVQLDPSRDALDGSHVDNMPERISRSTRRIPVMRSAGCSQERPQSRISSRLRARLKGCGAHSVVDSLTQLGYQSSRERCSKQAQVERRQVDPIPG